VTSLAGYGNTQYDGKYVLSGSATNVQPFVVSGSHTPPYSYNGNDTQVSIQVAPWTNVSSNVIGRTVFNMGSSAVPTSPDLFATIQALKDEIDAGDGQAVSGLLADVKANLNNVITVRSEVGARISRIEATSASLEDSKTSLSTLLSKTEDVDLSEAVLNLRTRENIYQAAIQTAARVINISLADYLGQV
jgi:flagellar hook-associated protein 3 FlgL